MKFLGLHNKPTAEVHPGHMLTGPKEEDEEVEEDEEEDEEEEEEEEEEECYNIYTYIHLFKPSSLE
jgi:ribosomal protein L12E/L44/L45/RPP1/RPP2